MLGPRTKNVPLDILNIRDFRRISLTKGVIFIIELPVTLPETFRNLPECELLASHLRRPLTGSTYVASSSQINQMSDV